MNALQYKITLNNNVASISSVKGDLKPINALESLKAAESILVDKDVEPNLKAFVKTLHDRAIDEIGGWTKFWDKIGSVLFSCFGFKTTTQKVNETFEIVSKKQFKISGDEEKKSPKRDDSPLKDEPQNSPKKEESPKDKSPKPNTPVLSDEEKKRLSDEQKAKEEADIKAKAEEEKRAEEVRVKVENEAALKKFAKDFIDNRLPPIDQINVAVIKDLENAIDQIEGEEKRNACFDYIASLNIYSLALYFAKKSPHYEALKVEFGLYDQQEMKALMDTIPGLSASLANKKFDEAEALIKNNANRDSIQTLTLILNMIKFKAYIDSSEFDKAKDLLNTIRFIDVKNEGRVEIERKIQEEKDYQEYLDSLKAQEAERAVKEAAEKAEADRIAAENQAIEEAERARVEAERVAKEAADKAEADRIAAENQARADAEKARVEAERLAKEAADKAEADRIAAENHAKADAEKARVEAERLAKEAADKAEADRIAAENQAKADAEIARVEAERVAKEAAEQKARQEQARIQNEAQAKRIEAERLKGKQKLNDDLRTATKKVNEKLGNEAAALSYVESLKKADVRDECYQILVSNTLSYANAHEYASRIENEFLRKKVKKERGLLALNECKRNFASISLKGKVEELERDSYGLDLSLYHLLSVDLAREYIKNNDWMNAFNVVIHKILFEDVKQELTAEINQIPKEKIKEGIAKLRDLSFDYDENITNLLDRIADKEIKELAVIQLLSKFKDQKKALEAAKLIKDANKLDQLKFECGLSTKEEIDAILKTKSVQEVEELKKKNLSILIQNAYKELAEYPGITRSKFPEIPFDDVRSDLGNRVAKKKAEIEADLNNKLTGMDLHTAGWIIQEQKDPDFKAKLAESFFAKVEDSNERIYVLNLISDETKKQALKKKHSIYTNEEWEAELQNIPSVKAAIDAKDFASAKKALEPLKRKDEKELIAAISRLESKNKTGWRGLIGW